MTDGNVEPCMEGQERMEAQEPVRRSKRATGPGLAASGLPLVLAAALINKRCHSFQSGGYAALEKLLSNIGRF